MKKEINLGTKIIFTATGEKYSIIEKTATGFQFKPIKFEKGLATVPRTFEEVKEEFLSSQIDIEGFEHNETDDCLVGLLMDGYIKDSAIEEQKNSLQAIASAKTELDGKFTEQTQLISQHEATIVTHEGTIKSHEASIMEQQEEIQEQKDYMQGQKDSITERVKEVSALKTQVSELESKLSKLNTQYTTDKENWESEKQKFEATIEGLQAMAE